MARLSSASTGSRNLAGEVDDLAAETDVSKFPPEGIGDFCVAYAIVIGLSQRRRSGWLPTPGSLESG
jgi:hypothetical protein